MSKQVANAVEGRAVSARPSLCLLLAAGLLCVSALAAPAAKADPPPPVFLTATNPTSSASVPANSTEPLVRGGEEGPIISSIRPRGLRGPIAADFNPENVVTIYTDSTCEGTPVAVGSFEELEGAGIRVEVAPDSTTTFYATQSEAGEPAPSECSSPGLTYWHSSTVVTPPSQPPGGGETLTGGTQAPGGSGAPPYAPRLRTVPGGRANDNTPLLTGSAAGAASVKVFATPNCAGAPVAKGSAEEFSAGLAVQVADDSVTTFSAYALVGGNQSNCSDPVTYVEDSSAPRTRITMGPGVKTRRRKAVFRFADTSGDPPGTTFLCRVDRKKWKQCRSPFKLRNLGFRRHVLRVRAIDLAGNAETKGAKRSFKVIHHP